VNCSECLERLQQALDEHRGADCQSAPPSSDLAQHLQSCASCRELFAAAERMQRGLELLPSPALPFGFTERVLSNVIRQRRLQRIRTLMRIAAVILVGVVGAWLVVTNFRGPEKPLPPELRPDVVQNETPPPSLQAQLNEAREATFGLTRQIAQDTARGARLLLPPADRLPDPMAPLNLEPPAMSVQDVSRTVADGFEPVTDSAKRAWSMFRRMVPGEERKRS
jgi:predicted anti-sigma-YlaC factor YlaD